VGEDGVSSEMRADFDETVWSIREIGARSEDSDPRYYTRTIERCAHTRSPKDIIVQFGDDVELHIIALNDKEPYRIINTVLTRGLEFKWGEYPSTDFTLTEEEFVKDVVDCKSLLTI
jgi:hypothetical protein